jgi:hypothetical protein
MMDELKKLGANIGRAVISGGVMATAVAVPAELDTAVVGVAFAGGFFLQLAQTYNVTTQKVLNSSPRGE